MTKEIERFYEDWDVIHVEERRENAILLKAWLLLIVNCVCCFLMPDALLGLFIFIPLLINRKSSLKNLRNRRIYPNKSKPTLSISKREMILREQHYKWTEISSIAISNTGTYTVRSLFPGDRLGGCECAHIQLNNKIELLLDMGYNFHDKDKTRIIELFKKYCKNVDIQ